MSFSESVQRATGSMIEAAFAASAAAPTKHNFKVGDKVEIKNRDYFGDEGTVAGFCTNLLGKPLVEVDVDDGDDGTTCRRLVFYSHEIKETETMLFMNEGDVDDAVERYRNRGIMGDATSLLRKFVDVINENSDGWPYWKQGPQAAKRLIELIQSVDPRGKDWDWSEPELTTADLKKAMRPIMSFCTRHNFTCPTM